VNDRQRERFDVLLEDVIEGLPQRVRAMLDEVPVVVMDRPTEKMLRQLIREGVLEEGADGSDLCGLHSGVSITDRGIDDPGGWGGFGDGGEPEQVHLFREGIVGLAFASEEDGGFEGDKACGWDDPDADERLYDEIRITRLHEIGHHFGLDEDDLENLGYA
jgi:predicted Zn-dependent protease with MMP-like domain